MVHRPDERIRIIHAVAGLRTLVVGDADSASRTLNLRQRLLKLNEVNAVGVLIVPHLDDLNVVALVDLAVEQGVSLVETETRVRSPRRQGRLVVDLLLIDVLPGCLGGQVEGRSRFPVDTHVDASGGVIRQGEAQVQSVTRHRRREVDSGFLARQGDVRLPRGFNRS